MYTENYRKLEKLCIKNSPHPRKITTFSIQNVRFSKTEQIWTGAFVEYLQFGGKGLHFLKNNAIMSICICAVGEVPSAVPR